MNGPERGRESPELRAALRALASGSRNREAPAEVEARLVQAFRAQRAQAAAVRPALPRRWLWMAAAAAALLLAAVGLRRGDGQPARVAVAPVAPVAAAVGPAVAPTPAAPPVVLAQAAPKVRKTVRRTAARPPAPEAAKRVENDEGEFIPLPYAARLHPGEALDVVRVRVPRSTMMRFGLPVSAESAWEPVKADLVVGQDGMTRAIRFVR